MSVNPDSCGELEVVMCSYTKWSLSLTRDTGCTCVLVHKFHRWRFLHMALRVSFDLGGCHAFDIDMNFMSTTAQEFCICLALENFLSPY